MNKGEKNIYEIKGETKKALSLSFVIFGVAIFSFLFLISLVSAAPPFQQSVSSVGLDIRFPQVDTVKQFNDIEYNIHVYNKSDGMLVTNTTVTCHVHLYNSTGYHVYDSDMAFSSVYDEDFVLFIDGGNFSTIQRMSAITQCNSSSEGGFVSFGFDVTPTGEKNVFGFQIFLFIFLFGLVIFGFFVRNEWIVILGGMGLMALGIFSLTQGISTFRNDLTTMVSLVTIGFGAIVAIVTGIQAIDS